MNSDPSLPRWQSAPRAFLAGVFSIFTTVLTLVLFATYIGIGALAHDTGFSLFWTLASTWLVWAGPAQIILIAALGSGATTVQAAIAVTVSAIRLFPMVASVIPMIRTEGVTKRHLVWVSHFVAVTHWVESFRLLPQVPRERRYPFSLGLGVGLVASSSIANVIGYVLAARLPPLLGAAILLLTPLAFLLSTIRNSGRLADRIALLLGLVLFPVVAWLDTGIDILIAGMAAGSIGYAVDRMRRKLA